MLRSILVAVSVIATVNASIACTAVDIVAADKSVIAGRTMEWAFDMKWTLKSVPKGTELTLAAPPELNLPENKVATKYAFVGVSAEVFTGGAFIEGQNEAGVGISGNFLPGFTQYQTVTKDDKNYVSVLGAGALFLGTIGSVAEAREIVAKTKVWTDPSLPSGPTPPTIHLVITDRTGDSIIAEWVGGEVQIHDNVAHVLTNAPTYDWHLLNVRNYLNLTTIGQSSRTYGTANVTALGQGGGVLGIPGDFTPPARFVRAAFTRHNITQPANASEAIQAIDHILNTVDIPLGIAQSKEGDQIVSDYTQWVAIKDLTNNKLMISDYAHRTGFVTLDLAKIFAQEKPTSILVTDLPYAEVDATSALGQ